MAKKPSKKILAIQEDAWSKAISIVQQERTLYEDALCYVTDKVAFRMRYMIRIFRKNYWGVFDNPNDTYGREKIWMHLAMSIVEDILKNVDIDQKDVGFRAKGPGGIPLTDITRAAVKESLKNMYFGETLDTDERQCLIDGTVVWKTWTHKGKVKRKTVDLLNFYIDPTEENIQSAYRVTERCLQTPDEIRGMTGWFNTDEDLSGSTNLSKNDGAEGMNRGTGSTGSFRDVWETWGKIPRWLTTLDQKADNANEEIDGHIIISGLDSGKVFCHLIEENKNTDKERNIIKPYEEWRPAKITGRWYGIGPVERILALQEYLNTTVNIRRTRSFISQLGLFKIKKGVGITPQSISKLPVNGAIAVSNMDDIQQMAIQEVGPTSYKDEDVIVGWAQKVTSAFPVTSGELLPASTTATAVAVANTNAKSAYALFKESTGSFIERWLDRHALKHIIAQYSVGDILKITDDDQEFNKLVERIATLNVYNALDGVKQAPTEEMVTNAIITETNRLKSQPQVFLKLTQEMIAKEVDTYVQVTNEDLDTSVTVQNLMQMISLAPEYKESTVAQIFDLLGLPQPKVGRQVNKPQPSPEQPSPIGANQQQIMTDAIVPQAA